MNPIDPKQLDDADLIINFYDNTLCTDYRQELAKEIYRRAGAMDESVNTTRTGPKR
ncbi:hypothetical protein D1872_88480 [compost metagenome]